MYRLHSNGESWTWTFSNKPLIDKSSSGSLLLRNLSQSIFTPREKKFLLIVTNCDNTIILIILPHYHLLRNTQGYRHLTATVGLFGEETMRHLVYYPMSINQLSWLLLDSCSLSPKESFNHESMLQRKSF